MCFFDRNLTLSPINHYFIQLPTLPKPNLVFLCLNVREIMATQVGNIVDGSIKDSDIQIAFEDQQRINQFARLNAKNDDLKLELKAKNNDLTNLQDALEEIELCVDDKIPMLIGECFLHQDQDETTKALMELKEKYEKEVVGLKAVQDKIQSQMSDLKALLYAKFGDRINLEE